MTGNQCIRCVHYEGEFKCGAFPERIPEEVLSDEHDHREPYPGDHGIRWKPLSPQVSHKEPS